MTEPWRQKLYREIPKVDEFLVREIAREALDDHPRWAVLDAVREILEERRILISGLETPPGDDGRGIGGELEKAFSSRLKVHATPLLRPLVNATGIIVHTNLGRSVLATAALDHALDTGRGYSNLEYDIGEGTRGSRQSHLEKILCRLTGAESALAVNNNAAAVLLGLDTLAGGREVVVSRGQLVEIGGSFRIPDVMAKSGALLREVGTTNKTHLRDYRDAIGADTALLLKVHTSNFQVVGFTSSVDAAALVALGRDYDLPVMEDLGSGSLVDLAPYGLGDEPTVQSVVEAGVDIVTFSGDKLLGGPQAGLIVGRKALVDMIRLNPLHRAVRLDKMAIAALEATLRLYLEGDAAFAGIPTLRMISEPLSRVRARARRLYRRVSVEARRRLQAGIVPSAARVGGGSLPLREIPSSALAMGTADLPAQDLEAAFRSLSLPVVGRISEGRLLFDLRTVGDDEVPGLAASIETVAAA